MALRGLLARWRTPPAAFEYPEWDREAPATRFTSRVAICLSPGEAYMRRAEYGDTGVASEALTEMLGAGVLEEQPGLGRGRALDGGIGRGASGWAAVVEWAMVMGAGGVIGGA